MCTRPRPLSLLLPCCPESSLELTIPAVPALLSSASVEDGPLLSRLETNAREAVSMVSVAVSTATSAVQQCVPVFVFNARSHSRAMDKRLEMKSDELADTVKTLEACLQLLRCGDDAEVCTDDCVTVAAVKQLMRETDTIVPVSTVLTHCGGGGGVQCLTAAFHVVIKVDPHRCKASHARWLTRGKSNSVRICLFDRAGEPVFGVTPPDVRSFIESEAVGWSVVSVSTSTNVLSVEVALADRCSDTAALTVSVGGTEVVVPFTVRQPSRRPFTYCMQHVFMNCFAGDGISRG